MKGGAREGSGRPKGSVNKRTLEAIELAKTLGVDPLEVLLLFAKGDHLALGYDNKIDQELRANSAAKACEYIYAKRKAIDVTSGDDPIPPPIINVFGNGSAG